MEEPGEQTAASPPAWWCGLKSPDGQHQFPCPWVTTCVVVWIEIAVTALTVSFIYVTTCVVVWIEMVSKPPDSSTLSVTTCVVVWIEISLCPGLVYVMMSHHLRGGVD